MFKWEGMSSSYADSNHMLLATRSSIADAPFSVSAPELQILALAYRHRTRSIIPYLDPRLVGDMCCKIYRSVGGGGCYDTAWLVPAAVTLARWLAGWLAGAGWLAQAGCSTEHRSCICRQSRLINLAPLQPHHNMVLLHLGADGVPQRVAISIVQWPTGT